MARPTVKALKKKVHEFLELKAAAERYARLEKEIKADMVALKCKEVFNPQGRVFISVSERVTVPVDVARSELGDTLAERVIVYPDPRVSNDLIDACVKTELISEKQLAELLFRAKKTPVTRLYVRPLA